MPEEAVDCGCSTPVRSRAGHRVQRESARHVGCAASPAAVSGAARAKQTTCPLNPVPSLAPSFRSPNPYTGAASGSSRSSSSTNISSSSISPRPHHVAVRRRGAQAVPDRARRRPAAVPGRGGGVQAGVWDGAKRGGRVICGGRGRGLIEVVAAISSGSADSGVGGRRFFFCSPSLSSR